MLTLQTGKTFTDKQGYTHGDFIAVIEMLMIDNLNRTFSVHINIYKSLIDKNAGQSMTESVNYSVEGPQFDTIMAAIKNQIKNNDKTLLQAIYILLLTRPEWADWE